MSQFKVGLEVRTDNPFPLQADYQDADDFLRIVGSPELMPYPTQLRRSSLFVVVDGNGAIKNLPYNRWGIVGNFAVVKMKNGNFVSMTQRECAAVGKEIMTTRGYLDPACELSCVFREPFAQYGQPPLGAVPTAGAWFK